MSVTPLVYVASDPDKVRRMSGGDAMALPGQMVSTLAWDGASGLAQIFLNGATGNRIEWSAEGLGLPAFTTRTPGTKMVLYPNIDASNVDYAIGVAGGVLWLSIPSTLSTGFRFYAGETLVGRLTAASVLTVTGGLGFETGAGGTVTQATDKSTGVTLNKPTGDITLNSASLAAGTAVSFTLTNSEIAASDLIIPQHHSGGTIGAYALNARATGAGTAEITVRNLTGGALAEAIVIKFAVVKAVTS